MDEPNTLWGKVLWSDLTKFDHNDKKCVWRIQGEAFKPNTAPYAMYGGCGIMIWGCFAASGTLQKADEKIKEDSPQVNS